MKTTTLQNDECRVCGGDGIADGACDCAGNTIDECVSAVGAESLKERVIASTLPNTGYDCAGECLADADGDGVCDLSKWPVALTAMLVMPRQQMTTALCCSGRMRKWR